MDGIVADAESLVRHPPRLPSALGGGGSPPLRQGSISMACRASLGISCLAKGGPGHSPDGAARSMRSFPPLSGSSLCLLPPPSSPQLAGVLDLSPPLAGVPLGRRRVSPPIWYAPPSPAQIAGGFGEWEEGGSPFPSLTVNALVSACSSRLAGAPNPPSPLVEASKTEGG